ncbi:fatty acyl-AMP ligase [Corallococcus sp. ZKHCc1 1396]|uniref:Fatty acyl-AMP ligase n=1 Tax=Corallococcus soli TaxID=2710757 RepID=A0ABR9PU06_9BACT|nr:fatty acyl-AMP ligase [Corallococcus soli]MBE4751406.1 fatty acyl-AMP ligase [Corallococcus soli]
MTQPTIIDRFHALASAHPGDPLYTWVDDEGRDRETLSFGDTLALAEVVAAQLTEKHGLRAGDRVLLVYPPSLDFVVTFLGCLLAGLVPAPVYPPNPLGLEHDLGTFAAIATDCRASAVLTNASYARMRQLGAVKRLFTRNTARWPDVPWHTVAATRGTAAAPTHVACPADVAFLQYTSGSTSTPKGVMITHTNIVAEAEANARDLGLRRSVRCVFWVPQYHDFGLISGILSALAGNGHLYMMSPMAFVRRPSVWLEVMSRVRATHSATPNFGLELAVRKTTPTERARWDLSALEAIVCAAEPVRAATLDAFNAAFGPAGLSPTVVRPSYGLAEHTVSVTVGRSLRLEVDRASLEAGRAVPRREGAPSMTLVGCGHVTKPNAVVRIVSPDTGRPCADGEVGEIWVDSPTKAAGYFGREEATREFFGARVDDPADDRTYLRTGDLGFFWDGELVPTGRCKDLIIIRGRNYYPQDVEDDLRAAHPSIRPGGVAAFARPNPYGEEELVVVVEVAEERSGRAIAGEVATAVRRLIQASLQVSCAVVVVGAKGTVPKTTSGKVRRQACRESLSDGSLESAATTFLVSRVPSGAEVIVPAASPGP